MSTTKTAVKKTSASRKPKSPPGVKALADKVNEELQPVKKLKGRPVEPYGLLLPDDFGSLIEILMVTDLKTRSMACEAIPDWDFPIWELGVIREFRFDLACGSAFDFAIPRYKIALEVEGGIFSRGRHNTGMGSATDAIKYNRAAAGDWLVFRACTLDFKYYKNAPTGMSDRWLETTRPLLIEGIIARSQVYE